MTHSYQCWLTAGGGGRGVIQRLQELIRAARRGSLGSCRRGAQISMNSWGGDHVCPGGVPDTDGTPALCLRGRWKGEDGRKKTKQDHKQLSADRSVEDSNPTAVWGNMSEESGCNADKMGKKRRLQILINPTPPSTTISSNQRSEVPKNSRLWIQTSTVQRGRRHTRTLQKPQWGTTTEVSKVSLKPDWTQLWLWNLHIWDYQRQRHHERLSRPAETLVISGGFCHKLP